MPKLKIKRKKTNVAERTKWNDKHGGSGVDESIWTENKGKIIKHNKHRVIRNPITKKIMFRRNVSQNVETISSKKGHHTPKARVGTKLAYTEILGKRIGKKKIVGLKGKKADKLDKKLRKRYAKAKRRSKNN